MFALHWICALTLALISCLSSHPVKRDAKELLHIISGLKTTLEDTECAKDTNETLYSPVNIREDCLYSALVCTLDELRVLQADCFIDEDEDLLNTISSLEHTNWTIARTSRPDCICEMYEKTSVMQFVDNVKLLVQQLNSK